MVEERILEIFDREKNEKRPHFSNSVLRHVNLDRIWKENEQYCIEFSLIVYPGLCNMFGTLHEGAITVMVDHLSYFALKAEDELCERSVSTDISITFCSTARNEDRLRIAIKSLGSNGIFAYARIDIYVGNRAIASGNHSIYKYRKSLAY